MFKTRLLSGILLVIIALVTVITGGNLLFAVLLLISLIGMTELYKVFHIEKKAPGIVGYIFAILYYGLLYFKPLLPGESLNWFVMLFMAFLICQMSGLSALRAGAFRRQDAPARCSFRRRLPQHGPAGQCLG